ncbi:MAG TPA: ribonuclease HII [Pseudoclavibacter sp.]|nr:ribonuclease HII [Pseudoclavibacter sp.]
MTVIEPTFEAERALLAQGARVVIGVDEVGRGALAGPVAVGAVAVRTGRTDPPAGLRDSKLLSPRRREGLREPLIAWSDAHAVGYSSPHLIDTEGIIPALGRAAAAAVQALGVDAADLAGSVLLLDGVFDYITEFLPGLDVRFRAKADRDCAVVAAASVLAKVERDQLMCELGEQFPAYGFAQNKGYGSAAHRAAIRQFGPASCHRLTWIH